MRIDFSLYETTHCMEWGRPVQVWIQHWFFMLTDNHDKEIWYDDDGQVSPADCILHMCHQRRGIKGLTKPYLIAESRAPYCGS